MPILNDETMDTFFGYSAVRTEELGATEYTLVDIELDKSPSVSLFKTELEKMLATIIKACQDSPRSDNLLIRINFFNDEIEEIHGFKMLDEINCGDPTSGDLGDYTDVIDCSKGFTALFDATLSGINAIRDYGEILAGPGNDFSVNSILFVITDGMDNSSINRSSRVADELRGLVKSESTRAILIGVDDSDCRSYLEDFSSKAGFDQFIGSGDASPKKFAKLANFVSQSISSQSQALGTGGSSQPISMDF